MTETPRFGHYRRTQQMRTVIGAALLVATIASCKASDLNITNPNNATVAGALSDPTAFQLLVTGLMSDYRGDRGGTVAGTIAELGRESYTFNPQEGRTVTNALMGISVGGQKKLDPAGFATGPWGGPYGALRDIFNFKNTVNGSPTLTAAGKAASLGMAQTLEAAALMDIVLTKDTLGGITEIKDNAADLAPFVSRDSMYKYILNTLDNAATNLAAGGTAFPFSLSPGFAGFTTPATFTQFNRALKARASAWYATAGGGAAAWAACLAALQGSFLNAGATTRAALDVGVYATHGVAPDSPNGESVATNTTTYVHMSLQTDAQLKADGVTRDDRFTSKTRTLPLRQGPVTGDGSTTGSSTLGFSIWPAQNSSTAIVRNEELILLRAEAELATGNAAGAIADLNQVRVNSGGLPPTTLTAGSSTDAILTGILYEKRYSLLMEGNRWLDMRRYGKLSLLPLDVKTGNNANFVAIVIPVPQAECLVRAHVTGNLLGPNGLNNCAP
jgi:hypothetical protein